MKAVLVDPAAPGGLKISEVERPVLTPNQALVKVMASTLNAGELRMAKSAPAGARIGWDVAGIVEQQAADGSGPAVGTRVAGAAGTGAWAEYVVVPTDALGELPEGVSFTVAATLPVAAVTALHAVEHGTSLLARRALVTGAAGGVGHFAVQIAKRYGAGVVGQVRREEQRRLVLDCGADEVVVTTDGAALKEFAPYRLIVDGVGGAVLSSALGLLAPGGACAIYGAVGGADVSFSAWSLVASGAVVQGAGRNDPVVRESGSEGMARVLALVADGRLKPHLAAEESWTDIGRLAKEFGTHGRAGKTVIRMG